MPELRELMRRAPWDESVEFPWEQIKAVWEQYWDQDKQYLVEKSPPHLIRMNEIEEHFQPLRVIIMVRDPYALCEGLMRRSGWSALDAAKHTVRCMRQQKLNAEKFSDAPRFTYEQLVSDPGMIVQAIQAYLPDIGEIDMNAKFKVHSIEGAKERKIMDFNEKKLRNLSVGSIRTITRVLKENEDIMSYWGYDYYQPTPGHSSRYVKSRANLFFEKISGKIKRRLGRSA